MGIINGICDMFGEVVSTVVGSPLIPALKYTVKAVTPLILNTLNNNYNSNLNYKRDITTGLDTKRQVAVVNNVMGENVDLISYEIINCVNTITTAINDLISDLGEENVYIDELLIGYFIQKFKVPAKYVDKVYRILENSYMIENKCLRDGIRLDVNGVKKKELETDGAKHILKHRKQGEIDSVVIDEIFNEFIKQQIEDNETKHIIG